VKWESERAAKPKTPTFDLKNFRRGGKLELSSELIALKRIQRGGQVDDDFSNEPWGNKSDPAPVNGDAWNNSDSAPVSGDAWNNSDPAPVNGNAWNNPGATLQDQENNGDDDDSGLHAWGLGGDKEPGVPNTTPAW
jgi:hypothetical protein